ncbi:MAG: 2OG-Fe(II) oxygenase [Wenzhouxiangellaceae bacterium]|nr:2OG-Fe(II) oxygenase [Wenzhouxiangellaceae bacterium]
MGGEPMESAETERGRGTVSEACRMKLIGRPVPVEVLVRTAREHPAFAAAWLAHALGSDAGVDELALVLALARLHDTPGLADLGRFWREFPGPGVEVPGVEVPATARAWVERFGLEWPKVEQPVLEGLLRLPEMSAEGGERRPVAVCKLPIKAHWLDWLREYTQPRLTPAGVYGQQAGELRQQVRDSDQALMPLPSAHPVSASIERLMAWSCGKSMAFAEPMVALRYRTGQQYRWHRDYFQPGTPATDRELENFGQRVHTGILYVNDGFEGGETEFRDWQLVLRPALGSVVSFSGVHADGTPDPDSIHRGRPVQGGEKWIATLWFRDRPLWNRRGLLSPGSPNPA